MKNKKSNLYKKNDVSRTCHVIGNVFLQLWNNKYQNTTLYRSEARNTVLKAGEIFQTVLHRKSDMYYLDPVLYQPGGVKVKALEYPVTLDLKVKQGMGVSSLELAIQQEESLYQKDVDARL